MMTIDYVAGLFDGEGSLMITRYLRKGEAKHSYRGYVQLTNSNPVIVSEYIKFLRAHDLPYHVHTDDRSDAGKKICYQVSVTGMDGIKRWLELMMPHLIGKKAEAEILYDYITGRIRRNADFESRRDSKTGCFRDGFRAPYEEAEIKLYERLRSMHHAGTSETTCEALVNALNSPFNRFAG